MDQKYTIERSLLQRGDIILTAEKAPMSSSESPALSGLHCLGKSNSLKRRLPDVTYHLWIRPNTVNPLVRRPYELIRSSRSL